MKADGSAFSLVALVAFAWAMWRWTGGGYPRLPKLESLWASPTTIHNPDVRYGSQPLEVVKRTTIARVFLTPVKWLFHLVVVPGVLVGIYVAISLVAALLWNFGIGFVSALLIVPSITVLHMMGWVLGLDPAFAVLMVLHVLLGGSLGFALARIRGS